MKLAQSKVNGSKHSTGKLAGERCAAEAAVFQVALDQLDLFCKKHQLQPIAKQLSVGSAQEMLAMDHELLEERIHDLRYFFSERKKENANEYADIQEGINYLEMLTTAHFRHGHAAAAVKRSMSRAARQM